MYIFTCAPRTPHIIIYVYNERRAPIAFRKFYMGDTAKQILLFVVCVGIHSVASILTIKCINKLDERCKNALNMLTYMLTHTASPQYVQTSPRFDNNNNTAPCVYRYDNFESIAYLLPTVLHLLRLLFLDILT